MADRKIFIEEKMLLSHPQHIITGVDPFTQFRNHMFWSCLCCCCCCFVVFCRLYINLSSVWTHINHLTLKKSNSYKHTHSVMLYLFLLQRRKFTGAHWILFLRRIVVMFVCCRQSLLLSTVCKPEWQNSCEWAVSNESPLFSTMYHRYFFSEGLESIAFPRTFTRHPLTPQDVWVHWRSMRQQPTAVFSTLTCVKESVVKEEEHIAPQWPAESTMSSPTLPVCDRHTTMADLRSVFRAVSLSNGNQVCFNHAHVPFSQSLW